MPSRLPGVRTLQDVILPVYEFRGTRLVGMLLGAVKRRAEAEESVPALSAGLLPTG